MEYGNFSLPEGWEIIPDYMTLEEKRLWLCERNWKKRIRKIRKKGILNAGKAGWKARKKYYRSYYERTKELDKRPKLICILGPSGSGKSQASYMLNKMFGVHVICSYTTRPKRRNEKDGVSHYFVSEVPPADQMLAYTKFGGYEYWALKSDVVYPATVYVIDEAGINGLLKFSDMYRIVVMKIECRETIRYSRGVSKERMERDRERVPLECKVFISVDNNRTKSEFAGRLRRAYKRIMKL